MVTFMEAKEIITTVRNERVEAKIEEGSQFISLMPYVIFTLRWPHS